MITTNSNLSTVQSPYADEKPMPRSATGSMVMLASGFGIGALVVLFAFMFLIGIGSVGQNNGATHSPAAQSASTQPVAPGPAPNGVPNTGGNSVPQTTGQAAPAPANPNTPKAPTVQQQQH